MKAEKTKIGLFHRLRAFLTHNWGLRLLSLALAIIVYYSLKSGISGDNHTNNDRKLFQYR